MCGRYRRSRRRQSAVVCFASARNHEWRIHSSGSIDGRPRLKLGQGPCPHATQLRQSDTENRWACKDGIWILRTTRQWFHRDLDVLKPLFERMRAEGSDFLQKNVALTVEVRRTFADIDRIEKELGRASKAIQSASGLVIKYKGRLQELCDNAAGRKMAPTPERGAEGLTNRSS
jgi:hypothetical protein